MKNTILTSKADTLLFLKDKIKRSYIDDLLVFTCGEFTKDEAKICEKIKGFFGDELLAIRSSCSLEDCYEATNTGRYESVLNVKASDSIGLKAAIYSVIESYARDIPEDQLSDEQIIVQCQAVDIIMSGVCFTRDIIHARPYYVITYDETGDTRAVTSGRAGVTKWVANNYKKEFLDFKFDRLLEAVKELESIYEEIKALDIEFGIDSDNNIIIFQVRRLVAAEKIHSPMNDKDFKDIKALAKCIYLDTNQIFLDRAFWIPIDQIGSNPRPLDYSIYEELLTKDIWSSAITSLGYNHVKAPLMYKIGNKPYISMQYSYEGLMPTCLRDSLKNKVYKYYDEKFRFEKARTGKLIRGIIYDAFSFTTPKLLENMKSEFEDIIFSDEEISEISRELKSLTESLVKYYPKMTLIDKEDVEIMDSIRENIEMDDPLKTTNSMKLYKYIDDLVKGIKEHMIPQYARQKRAVYIAKKFAKSLVDEGYVDEEIIRVFKHSVETVFTDLEEDFAEYVKGGMTKDEFDRKYGFLRYANFDIRSERFTAIETPGALRKNVKGRKPAPTSEPLPREAVEKAIADTGLDFTYDELMTYVVDSKVNQDYFRFQLFKSVSLLLEIIARLGEISGIAREDMSYLELGDFDGLNSRESYIQIIESRRKNYHQNSYLVLPDIIFGVGDIDISIIDESRPNFITTKVVEGEVADFNVKVSSDIFGKVVLLKDADPTYDWVLSQGVAGIITLHGGATSHMAIRCAEAGIPAAIGCGERIYNRVKESGTIVIDCKTKSVR